ncbi:hypothetical protein [Mesorhizobium sp. NZP2077]|uniref:hypothetical protein n=1 Tax=Mesorhizobium sp. NZP2077 TaxID=2483404 RepID=UPI0015530B70|nr:hypothetical protein [Mesorhizobium sp. NZP2077]QKC85587.1 hypothetical protein EB232_32200 [Mesorhizobium sp. NZP2077]QKD19226.1 hypothetical protein HGP13_31870 [Mesorhizobium sp. NZP2077]
MIPKRCRSQADDAPSFAIRNSSPGHHVRSSSQIFNFRYKSADHFFAVFKTYYGPTNRAFAALDADGQVALKTDIFELLDRMNRGGRGTLIVPSEYLEAVITKR